VTMQRDDCLRTLARHIPDEIVVAVYSAAFDWVLIRPHALNYFAVGAMGLARRMGSVWRSGGRIGKSSCWTATAAC